jgi:Mn2+/Fe2+ NRAMP family transporter
VTRKRGWRWLCSVFGPGVVAGAANDDPSGIATFTIAGVRHGLLFLWTAFWTWPLMAAVQSMCSRIGMVTGRGLVGTLALKFPRWALVIASGALLVANTINLGADLSGMADAAQLVSGIHSRFWVVMFAAAIAVATVRLPYARIAKCLKWLTLVLFAYVGCGIIVVKDWGTALAAAFVPSFPDSRQEWATLVALMGTALSPYLFFWQTAQEVEEEKQKGRCTVEQRKGASTEEIVERRWDVAIGSFFCKLIMFFIILTAASALKGHAIENSRDAAEALRPLAGAAASWLYALGVIGVGFLAAPVLSGSAAYALAETFRWRAGLNETMRSAREFYSIIIVSTAVGIWLEYFGFNPMRALFWAGLINGALAPILLLMVWRVAVDQKIMQGQAAPRIVSFGAVASVVVMGGAALMMLL